MKSSYNINESILFSKVYHIFHPDNVYKIVFAGVSFARACSVLVLFSNFGRCIGIFFRLITILSYFIISQGRNK